jgi:hypothetical protein
MPGAIHGDALLVDLKLLVRQVLRDAEDMGVNIKKKMEH